MPFTKPDILAMAVTPAHRTVRLALLALLLHLAPTQAALSPGSASEFHEKAVQLEADDEALAAIIEIKNALQRDPEHLPSLLLAGRIYLDQSLGLAAEDVLHTALNAGADRNTALPLLGEALLMQRKAARTLVELQVDGLNRSAAARVHALRARAHLLRRELDEARVAIEAAQALEPELLEARLADASRLMLEGDPRTASEVVAVAVEEHPRNSKAWSVFGAIRHALRDPDGALDAYARALENNPRDLDVRIARVGLLIDLARDDAASPDLEYIEENFSDEPRATYLRSVIAARRGDTEGARDALQQAVAALAPMSAEAFVDNPALQLIQGLAYYGLKQYEAAAPPLRSYIAKEPQDLGARKALGDTLLRLGAARDAIPVLEPVTTLAPRDTRAQLLLATAYAISGYANKASDLLEKATGESHTAAVARGRLAMLNIGAGRISEGLSDLAAAFGEDPSDPQGGVALVITYLRTGQSTEAVAAARTLLGTAPDNVVFHNLLGIALFVDDQLPAARAEFERVLEQAPDFRPAAINLGKLEVSAGDLDAARARFERLLAVKPDDSKLMLELSRVALAAGDRREGMRLAEDAARPREAGIDALFHLYDLYLQDGELERAYDLALRAKARSETNFDVLERLAAVLVRMNKYDDARTTLKNMSQVAGFDPDKQLRTAAMQARIGQFADAEYALFKALQENPDDNRIRLAQIEISLSKRAFDQAIERATAMIADQPGLATAFLFRAQANLALQRFDASLADYDRVNALSPSSEAVLGGYRALAASGRHAAARDRLEQWLDDHPKDASVRSALGEDLIRANELERARAVYAELIAQRPQDAGLLNNFAFLCLQLDDLPAAEKHAREAHALAPGDAMVNDTLGWILAQRGAHQEALEFLREALARRGSDSEIRYHLAVVLNELGRAEEARRQLEQALEDGRDFASRSAAQALRRSLAASMP